MAVGVAVRLCKNSKKATRVYIKQRKMSRDGGCHCISSIDG